MRFLWVALLAALPQAEPAPWRAGLATAKITPETPVVMAGYGGRNKPYQGVARDVYAKALVLEDGLGSRVAIVTADLCDTPAGLEDPPRPSEGGGAAWRPGASSGRPRGPSPAGGVLPGGTPNSGYPNRRPRET
jgi:hypothetical protein